MTKDIFCITGYPAAGKSTATSYLRENDLPVVSMGDIVRELATEQPDISIDDGEKIGNWATQYREENGNAVFAEITANRIAERTESKIIVDGLRTKNELQIFRDHFESVTVIFIDAPVKTRFERVQERGRDSEEQEFTLEEFKDRDKREEKWGLKEVKENCTDIYIENTESIDYLTNTLDEHIINT